MNDVQYTVYKHTAPNGKVYIGLTCQKNLSRRWQRGVGYRTQIRFYRAITKYGWDAFQHDVLFRGLSKEQAEKIEISLIYLFKANNPKYGYNIENGGNCMGTHSEETKRKISEAQRGEKNHMWGKHHVNYGKKMSAEFCEKNRLAHLGQKAHNKGVPMSEEQKAKLRGIPKTEEHKRKLSEAKSIPVKCVETGKVFKSGKAAAEWLGINRGCIANAIKDKHRAGGYHWEIAN